MPVRRSGDHPHCPAGGGEAALGHWRLTVLTVLALALAGGEPDPVVAAAQAAWDAGQPVQVADLLARHPAAQRPGAERLLLARSQLALGRWREVLATIGCPDTTAVVLDRWPVRLRAASGLVAGEAHLGAGRGALAGQMLTRALADGLFGVERERALALLLEQQRAGGDASTAERLAAALWEEGRGPQRLVAGLALAELLAKRDPLRSRELLAAVRVADGLPAGLRRVAGELLCSLLLDDAPGQCLVVTEQDLARLPVNERGKLPLWRALALVALDPGEGAAALAALPAALRDLPAAQVAARRAAQPTTTGAQARRLERAEAAIDLGRWAEAYALAEPLASAQPRALAVLMRCPGVDPGAWRTVAAAAHPLAALAIGQALARAGRSAEAWPALSAALADWRPDSGVSRDALRWWTLQAAQAAGRAEDVARLRAALLADGTGLEAGLAWCDEAQARVDRGEDATAAWRSAAGLLPGGHPWQAAAAWRAARALVGAGDLAAAAGLLIAPARGDGADARRCRFLLAQVVERQGRWAEALALAEALLADRGNDGRERIVALIERLRASLAAGDGAVP